MAKLRVSAGIVPNIPEEIIESILERLPVRSLVRLQCVCKSWRSVISSKRFIESHLKISKKDKTAARWSVIFKDSRPSPIVKKCSLVSWLSGVVSESVGLDVPIKNPDNVSIENGESGVKFVGSCNGIICFMCCYQYFYLWNPSTRMFTELPDVDADMSTILSIRSYGFGFDEFNEDYKIVCVAYRMWTIGTLDDIGFEVVSRVYSLKSNTWKSIAMGKDYIPTMSEGKLVKHNFYWEKKRGSMENDMCKIVSFDLVSEVWESMEIPNFDWGWGPLHFCSLLGNVGGCLAVMRCSPEIGADVWVLKQYGVKESWDKILSIPYHDRCFTSVGSVRLYIGPEGSIMLLQDGKFTIYDLNDDSFKLVKGMVFVDVCIESLVPTVLTS